MVFTALHGLVLGGEPCWGLEVLGRRGREGGLQLGEARVSVLAELGAGL